MSLSQPWDFTPKYFAKMHHVKEHQLDPTTTTIYFSIPK